MSSPAPNLSPTSFIAGSSTSLSTRTGCSRTPAASSASSMPSFFRCTTIQWTFCSGVMPAVGSSFSVAPRRRSRRAVEVLDEALQRVRPAVEHEIVGERALLRADLGVRLHVRRIHDRHVEPRLDAVMQEHGVEHARALPASRPKLTFETPRIVKTPGSSRLMRRMPSIVSCALSRSTPRRRSRA